MVEKYEGESFLGNGSVYDKLNGFLCRITLDTAPIESLRTNILIPIGLFLLIFIIDFFISTQEFNKKEILQILVLSFFFVIASFVGLMQNSLIKLKILFFITLWFSIAMVKCVLIINELFKTEQNIENFNLREIKT